MTDPTDIIERLRTGTLTRGCAAAHEAADLIDRLRKENEEMQYIIELGSMTAEQFREHLRVEYGLGQP